MGAHDFRDIIKRSTRRLSRLIKVIHQKRRKDEIHEFRVAVKRLRALAPALDESLPEPLDDVFRASGRLRNLHVQRRLIVRILREQSMDEKGMDEFLRTRRRKARKKLRKLVRSLDLAGIDTSLKQLRKKTRERTTDELAAAVQSVREDRARALASLRDLTDPAQAHTFRQLLKEVFYLNEALGSADPRQADLERAAEALGEWHDCYSAQELVRRFLENNPRSPLEALPALLGEHKQRAFAKAMRALKETSHV